MATTIRRTAHADLGAVWEAVTQAVLRADGIPFTQVRSDPGPPGEGWRFVARTGAGPLGFDDRMRITTWSPPASPATAAESGAATFAVVKEGPILDGWVRATLTDAGHGSTTLAWVEEIRPRVPGGLGRLAPVGLVADTLTHVLFTPVLSSAMTSAGRAS